MTQKKATDLLVEIMDTQKELIGYIRNIDFTNKLILSKLQTTSVKNLSPTVGLPQEAPQMDFPQVLSQPKSQLQIALEEDEHEQMENDLITNEINPEGKRRTQRYVDSGVKKIPVQQRISYPDGKNVYMANVEIYDSNNALVKKTRTNQIGKWLAALVPGNYSIRVEKAATSLKQKVELSYMVTIPNSDTQVELELKKV